MLGQSDHCYLSKIAALLGSCLVSVRVHGVTYPLSVQTTRVGYRCADVFVEPCGACAVKPLVTLFKDRARLAWTVPLGCAVEPRLSLAKYEERLVDYEMPRSCSYKAKPVFGCTVE